MVLIHSGEQNCVNGQFYNDIADIEHWNRALEGRLTKKDWVDFFAGRGFRAGVDYPVSKYYR